jgi:hypothetical protein
MRVDVGDEQIYRLRDYAQARDRPRDLSERVRVVVVQLSVRKASECLTSTPYGASEEVAHQVVHLRITERH